MVKTVGRRFYAKVLIYSLIFVLLYLSIPSIQKLNSYVLSEILSFFVPVSASEDIVYIPYKATYIGADITAECSGIIAVAIIMAMILFPNTGLKKKAAGILLSIPLMLAGNILRIFLILAAGYVTSVSIIPIIHVISQAIIFLWIMLVWTIYLFYIVKKPRWEYGAST